MSRSHRGLPGPPTCTPGINRAVQMQAASATADRYANMPTDTLRPAVDAANQQAPRSSRSKARVSFPISVSVVEPILPLDAKALLDIIQAKSSLKKEPYRAEDEETWGLADASSGASEVNASGANSLSEASRRAHDEHHAVLACHTCPDLDDQSLFPDKVIENIVTANMEAKQLLRQLRSPLACGNFDKASQIHAFIERFAHLTDICSPAAHAAKLKLEKIPAKGVENWLESRASAGGADSSMAAARAARESRVALEESVRAVWREARQLCGTMGCHLPQPLPARQSEVNKSCSWDEQLRGIERALRECNRACRDSGIGIDDAGLAWNPADDSGTCRAKLEQALNERRSLLLVNKKLIQDHRQQQQVQQQQEELPKLPDEETAVYIAKLERCVAALSLKCNIPNPFQAN